MQSVGGGGIVVIVGGNGIYVYIDIKLKWDLKKVLRGAIDTFGQTDYVVCRGRFAPEKGTFPPSFLPHVENAKINLI